MFSNDGTLGYMQSAHAREAAPGGQGWNDLYWLGAPVAYPFSLSYFFVWFGNHYEATAIIIGLSAAIYGLAQRKNRRR
jgi:hypothetical protein